MKFFRPAAAVALSLAVGAVIGWNLPRAVPVPVQNASQFVAGTAATTSSMLVDYGDGRVVTYAAVPVTVGETVQDLMAEISRSRGLTVAWKDYGEGLGKLVTAIGETKNDARAGRFWSYWVNQQFAQVGISSFRLQPGDQVMWKYTTDQFRAVTK